MDDATTDAAAASAAAPHSATQPAAKPAPQPSPAPTLAPPMAMLAELTHRCPFRCPYCSNPLELDRKSKELSTAEWARVFEEAAALGVLQAHLSGGEPLARADLPQIVAAAAKAGLYTNLITAAATLTEAALDALLDAGLDHVQISFDGATAEIADPIGGLKGGHARKLAAARLVRAKGAPLTVNAVMHRRNLHQLDDIVDLAVDLDAARLEVANVQYYGWALKNRAALMPTPDQVRACIDAVKAARARLEGRLVIDYVAPDYYARFPKPCMGGWGRMSLNVTPQGRVLPCHAAETIPGLAFDSVRERPLAWIWAEGSAFQAFRGTDWMEEPCRSCDRREIDWGGCRCQAMAIAGRARAADPACSRSPHHDAMRAMAEADAGGAQGDAPPDFIYRGY